MNGTGATTGATTGKAEPRADLLALTPDTLAALANRGLVKRAAKELESGAGPEVDRAADGTVSGRHPDGTLTELPPGLGLDAARCSCGAAGVCRHRIGLVLAYQREAAAAYRREAAAHPEAGPTRSGAAPAPDGPPFTAWSPAEFDDAALTAALGRTAVAGARRSLDRGYSAVLHRATPEQPAPRAELPTCTVRFPVPHELGYALTDAAAPLRGEVVALAVWAFRAAEAADGPAHDPADGPAGAGATTTVTVGGRTAPAAAGDAEAALDAALALADRLLLEGVAQAGPVFTGVLDRAREALTAAACHWPAAALAELSGQLSDYAARDAGYRAERYALLLTELHARRRAGAVDPVAVLGTREAGETPLRRVRLVALGCRIGGSGRRRTADVFLAHPVAGIALVLHRRWDLAEADPGTGHELGARRVLGSPLRALAAANVVSEHTSRSAGRAVSIGRGRIAATSVTPVGTAWAELPDSLLVRDLAEHLRPWADRPPQLVRPRVEAEAVRVLAVEAVEHVGYDPAAQQLEALVRDPSGHRALVRADYNPHCPGGLDALAAALGGDGVRFVSGSLRREGGGVVLDPLAVLGDDGLVVPDLAPGDGAADLTAAPQRAVDEVTGALEAALAALAGAAHRGLRHLGGADHERIAGCADRLHRAGLHTAAGLVRDCTGPRRRAGTDAAGAAWVEAQLHLLVALELHQEQG